MDVWNKRDAPSAPLPPRQANADPGTSRIDPVELPRHPAQRGAALVSGGHRRYFSKRGWPAVSVARRAPMTKWCSAPRSATATNSIRRLGLESEGTAVDFQVGVNDYLYGTRFFSWLGADLRARESRRMAWPRRGQQGLLRRPVPPCLRPQAGRRLGRMDRLRAAVPEGPARQTVGLSADRGRRISRRSASDRSVAGSSIPRPTAWSPPSVTPARSASSAPWTSLPASFEAAGNQGHDALQGDQPRLRPFRPQSLLYRG